MHVEVPEYLYPKLKKTATHLNIPLSELVLDALVSYLQDLEETEPARLTSPYDVMIPFVRYEKTKKEASQKSHML